MAKVKTMDLRGKEYAQVKDRLKQFRDDCPNGLIETFPTVEGERILFKAHILKDKSDKNSAESTGHALGSNEGDKAFEKLETIAVGRALALLGYAQDGEIASGEEMGEFIQFQKEKLQKRLAECTAKLEGTSNLSELKTVWASFPAEVKKELEKVKNQLKTKYENS